MIFSLINSEDILSLRSTDVRYNTILTYGWDLPASPLVHGIISSSNASKEAVDD